MKNMKTDAPSSPDLIAAQAAYDAAVAADPNGGTPSLWAQATKDAAKEMVRCRNVVTSELKGG